MKTKISDPQKPKNPKNPKKLSKGLNPKPKNPYL